MPSDRYRSEGRGARGDGFADETADMFEKTSGAMRSLSDSVKERFVRQGHQIDELQRAYAENQRLLKYLAGQAEGGSLPARGGPAGISEQAARALGRICIAMRTGDYGPLTDVEKAAITSNRGESGGALLAPTVEAEVIRYVEQFGIAQRDARRVQVASKTHTLPKRTGGLSIMHPDFDVVITESSPTFGSVVLDLIRYTTLTVVDNSMLRDSLATTLGTFIAAEIAQAFAYYTDLYTFMGNGTPAHAKTWGLFKVAADTTNGIKDVVADTGDNTFAEVVAASTKYLSRVIGELPNWAEFFSPAWYMHKSVYWEYMGVRDSQNRPIAGTMLTGEGKSAPMLMGYPVNFIQVGPRMADSAASTTMAIFTPLNATVVLGQGFGGIEIATSTDVRFDRDQTVIRGIMRQSIALADGSAVVRLKTAAS